MKFTHLTIALFAATVIAGPVNTGKNDKKDPTFCERGIKLCDIANSWEDCSDLYIKTMEACKATGCIQWFIDPLKHCYDKKSKPTA
ncbi:hypothetical protein BZA77DRAFT_328083 [Pyronema omphalodes]|nr:hypothetical protein BZA77DRAFT_328083 [Pyronema omphalodes]